jgi:hypothetical protein
MRRVLGFVAAVSLVGCGDGSLGISSQLPAIAPAHANLTGKGLLYVIDSFGRTVDVYTYPQQQPVEQLTGFQEPDGLCADASGDVFVADARAYDIVEYAHGGSTPIATLADADSSPGGCAVNPKTGDLAVANEEVWGNHFGWGNVAIYKHGHGKPKLYADYSAVGFIDSYESCAYDENGNLYVSGYNSNGNGLAELPNGTTTFTNITLNKFFFSWGGVQWDGKYLALQRYDRDKNVIYRVAISGRKGTIVATVPTRGPRFIGGYFIDGDTVIVPNGRRRVNQVGTWSYPGGGNAKTEFKVPGTWFIAAVVSRAADSRH